MAWTDLREFLNAMEEEGEVLRMEDPVDPELEVGAVWTRLTRRQGPIGLHPEGTVEDYPDWRVATNLFGSFRRLARTFQVEEGNLFSFVEERIESDVSPVEVEDGPVNQNEYVDDEVDLTAQIPNIRWNEGDAGPFITVGHNVLTDPDYGTNTALYRIQLFGPRRLTVRLAPHHDGGVFVKRARASGRSELPVAIYIGGDPVAICGTVTGVSIERDEYDVIGSLRGEPLELTSCKTVDRLVPARAEAVIEGRIQLDEEIEEGPFGEFCGTYSGSYTEHPVHVTRIAHRDDPIFVGTAECRPVNETHLLQALFESIKAKTKLTSLFPEVKDVYLPPDAGGWFECIIQIDSDLKRPGLPKNILYGGVAGNTHAKTFVLVDDDVDIRRRDEVQTALATRVQAKQDVITLSDGVTTSLDPSSSAEGVTDKMLVDATIDEDFRGELIRLNPEAKRKADELIRRAKTDADAQDGDPEP